MRPLVVCTLQSLYEPPGGTYTAGLRRIRNEVHEEEGLGAMSGPGTGASSLPDSEDEHTLPGREPLDRRRIMEVALGLIDREGLEALSMRRLGAGLGGYEAASLYNYFASKAELLDGMVELVWSKMKLPAENVECWERLRQLALCWRELSHLHPRVFPLLANRPVRSPEGWAPVEFAFQTFRDAGFHPQLAGSAFLTLVAYVYGFSEREISRQAEGKAGKETRLPGSDATGVPITSRPLSELAHFLRSSDWDLAFEWGLDVTLSGLRAKVPAGKMPFNKGLP